MLPKVFVICDLRDTAPVWGYILQQQGLTLVLETSTEKAIDHWTTEMPDLVAIDIPHHLQYRNLKNSEIVLY